MTTRERFWTLTAFFLTLLIHIILLSPLSDWIDQLLFSEPELKTIEIDLETKTSDNNPLNYKNPIKRLLAEKAVKTKSSEISAKKVQESEKKNAAPLKRVDQSKAKIELAQPYQEAISKVDRKILKQEGNNKLQFTMNTYKWSYDYYIENWAVDLQKWWRAPADYRMGKIPKGGSVWLRVEMERDGSLRGYEVLESEISNDMELKVIQAVTLSMKRPALPKSFPEEFLIINWRFVYPPKRQ